MHTILILIILLALLSVFNGQRDSRRRGFLHAHEVLGDAEVINHLGDTEERRDDDHPTEGSFEEGRRAFIFEDLFKGVRDSGIGLFGSAFVQSLQIEGTKENGMKRKSASIYFTRL